MEAKEVTFITGNKFKVSEMVERRKLPWRDITLTRRTSEILKVIVWKAAR